MKSNYFLIFFLYNSICTSQIRNSNIPSCRNCVFFKPPKNRDFSCILGQCEKFGDKNILSDEIKYDYVKICRLDETKCGLQGKYFNEEKNVDFKIWKHSISNFQLDSLWIFTISTVFLQIYFIIKK
jgi:hypothetical protein